MKYFVERDKERQAEPPVDPIDAFFKSIAATVTTFSPYHQNVCKSKLFSIVSEVEMTEILQETKSTHSSEYSSSSQMNLVYNETAFVIQILLQPGIKICATELIYIVQYGYILLIVCFSVLYANGLSTFLAAVKCFFVTSINVFE
jgi:hypothetical protein